MSLFQIPLLVYTAGGVYLQRITIVDQHFGIGLEGMDLKDKLWCVLEVF